LPGIGIAAHRGTYRRTTAGGRCRTARGAISTPPEPIHPPQEPATAMPLSTADIHRIAHLARIEIDAAQAEEVRAKLDAIFAMINELRAVDTTGVVPMAHAQDVMLPLREDLVTETDQHPLYQAVAPAVEDGLYLVPKVIE
jgi:aspartyl-tRNA(Asn)/glutamyl-tRNA(Gln) amidotransferase subunit C